MSMNEEMQTPIPEVLTEGTNIDSAIDTSGLTCPLPILRAKKALATMLPGQVLQVLATDKNSLKDFQAFAAQTHNNLLAQRAEEGQFYHWLRKRNI